MRRPCLVFEESLEWYRKNAVSDRNIKFYNIRKSVFNKAVYRNCEFVGDDLWVRFLVYPTYGQGKYSVKIYDEYGNERKGKFYEVIISFVGIKKVILDTFLDLKWVDKLKQIVLWYYKWEDIKLYANDPSFFIQGVWYRLDKKGASVYKFPSGFTDKGIWARRHGKDLYLTKHILNVLDIFKFNCVDIAGDIIDLIKKMRM